jgi:uncharacterized protein CbrC (UPF0167 family)
MWHEPDTLPRFKYHPDPLATGAIERDRTHCPVCDQERAYVYTGPSYGRQRVEGICPWCLADGAAAARFGLEFTTPHSYALDVEAQDELLHRTPGYTPWQEQDWPDHHGDYCAFVGYVGWAEIAPLAADDLRADIDEMKRSLQLTQAEIEEWVNGSDLQGYLFRCLICGHHRLLYDLD